jgi:hypothetical protein
MTRSGLPKKKPPGLFQNSSFNHNRADHVTIHDGGNANKATEM